MSTTFIAMGIALTLTIGFVISIGLLSLLFGVFDWAFGKPKLILLKSAHANGFGFGFKWNSAQNPVKLDHLKIRIFNPFGSPTQLDISRKFEGKDSSFAEEVDLGNEKQKLMSLKNVAKATIQIEISSQSGGIAHQFLFKAEDFFSDLNKSCLDKTSFIKQQGWDQNIDSKPPIDVPVRSFIADTVPGKGAQIFIPTNPAFLTAFAGGTGGSEAKSGAAVVENFKVAKVWIEPNCIVCNACEGIFPEVFDVQPNTCVIRPDAPLDDGLKIQEAAEACPVEVIKFVKA